MQRKSLGGILCFPNLIPRAQGKYMGLDYLLLFWAGRVASKQLSSHLHQLCVPITFLFPVISTYLNWKNIQSAPSSKIHPKHNQRGGSKLGRHLKAVFLPDSFPPSTIINWLCKGLKRVLAEPVEDRNATYSGQKSQTNSVKRWQTGELIQKV